MIIICTRCPKSQRLAGPRRLLTRHAYVRANQAHSELCITFSFSPLLRYDSWRPAQRSADPLICPALALHLAGLLAVVGDPRMPSNFLASISGVVVLVMVAVCNEGVEVDREVQ